MDLLNPTSPRALYRHDGRLPRKQLLILQILQSQSSGLVNHSIDVQVEFVLVNSRYATMVAYEMVLVPCKGSCDETILGLVVRNSSVRQEGYQ